MSTNTADIVIGLLLSLGSAAYLVHGWRRAARTVDQGLALATDADVQAAARQRHPSGRAR